GKMRTKRGVSMTRYLRFAASIPAQGRAEAKLSQRTSIDMDALSPNSDRAKSAPARQPDLGRIIGITGAGAIARLFKAQSSDEASRVTIGRLVGITVETSLIVGVVVRMNVSPPAADDHEAGSLVVDIDFMGEIKGYGSDKPSFQRGVSSYPTIGNV